MELPYDLSLADGSVVLEDTEPPWASWNRWFDLVVGLWAGACGAMSTDGVTGDWLPLGTLVRLPEFKELRCPRAVANPAL